LDRGNGAVEPFFGLACRLPLLLCNTDRGAKVENPHTSHAHRDIAAASLASLAATLAAIRAHAGDAQTSSHEGSDQDDSSFGADGDQPTRMRRLTS
jgi:hypothetical protein